VRRNGSVKKQSEITNERGQGSSRFTASMSRALTGNDDPGPFVKDPGRLASNDAVADTWCRGL
jgi:hypothetical protein